MFCSRPVSAYASVFYAALFAFRFIFPAAHLCLRSRESFLRAAALMWRRPRFFGDPVEAGGLPLRRPVELRLSIALIARSMWSRSDFNSVMILVMFTMAPLVADMVTVANGHSNRSTEHVVTVPASGKCSAAP